MLHYQGKLFLLMLFLFLLFLINHSIKQTFLGFEQINEMILRRNSGRNSDSISNEEVTRLLVEIEKMRETSRVTEERNRKLSEKMLETIDQLNSQKTAVSDTKTRAKSDTEKVSEVRIYPQIQMIVDSDENTLSRVHKRK